MKILHILKTEPDDDTEALVSALSRLHRKEATVIKLDDSTDYEELLDLIFKHERAISWW